MGFLDKIFVKKETQPDDIVFSPITGEVIDLKDIPDDVFSQGILGYGCGINPTDCKVYAPFDGEVIQVADTKHAIGIANKNFELLIHIGIDTVAMNGEGFNVKVKENQNVKKGDLLLEFDSELIKNKGYKTITVIIFTNISDSNKLEIFKSPNIKIGEQLFKLK